jgi:hypothetical protein
MSTLVGTLSNRKQLALMHVRSCAFSLSSVCTRRLRVSVNKKRASPAGRMKGHVHCAMSNLAAAAQVEGASPDPLVRAENTPGQYTVTYTTEATGLLLSDEVCRCASPVALGPAPVG